MKKETLLNELYPVAELTKEEEKMIREIEERMDVVLVAYEKAA